MQVEYAIEAIKLGSTAIGIQTNEGVVVAVEKRITSSLMEPHTIEKIVEVCSLIERIQCLWAIFYLSCLCRWTTTWGVLFRGLLLTPRC